MDTKQKHSALKLFRHNLGRSGYMFYRNNLERRTYSMLDFFIIVLDIVFFIIRNKGFFLIIHNYFNNSKVHCKSKGQAIAIAIFEILLYAAIFVFYIVGNVDIK